jgi:hypothetical protein
LSSAARADDAACIASSERDITLRKQQKLHDAMKELVACAAPACPTEVRAECARRLTELNRALPTVVFTASDAAGNDLSAVTVSLDGVVLVRSLDGRAVSIDPGNHTLRFEAAGQPFVEKTVVIAEGVKDRHVPVVIGARTTPELVPTPVVVPAAPPPATGPDSPPHPVVPTSEPSPSVERHGGGVRTAGFVIGGVGAAGVVAASIFGALAITGASHAKSECVGPCSLNSNPAAHNDMQTASTYATVSTAGFIGGGALLGAGVIMALVGGPARTTTGLVWAPRIAAGGGSLDLAGSF